MITRKLNRNIKSSRLERFQKSRKMERVEDVSSNLWYEFAKDLEKRMEKLGVLCDIYVHDFGLLKLHSDTGHWCLIYTTCNMRGSYPTQQVMVEQEDGSFKVGDTFELFGDPDAMNVVDALDWIFTKDAEEGTRKPCRKRRNEASMSDIADERAAQRYAEVDPEHCSKDEFMSRLKSGDLFVGRHYGLTSYFKVTGFRGGRVVLSSIGKKGSGDLVPGVSEPLYMPDPSKAGREKGAHALPVESYSGCVLSSRDWSFELWDGKWNFHDINGALGF